MAAAGNPPKAIDSVEASVVKLKPYRASLEQMPHGPKYICRWYDDAPSAQSVDFSWQVRVCRRVQKGPKA